MQCEVLTVRRLVNMFLTNRQQQMESGAHTAKTFDQSFRVCGVLVKFFSRDQAVEDLTPNDFARLRASLAKRNKSASGLRSTMGVIRAVFNFATAERLIKQPVHYGQSFNRPSAKLLRRDRNNRTAKMFEPDEIHMLMDAGSVIDKAMILLGINCGFGNTDIAMLPDTAIDLDAGWIEYPRPKTEIRRRIPLWPETIEAVREAINIRPKAAKQEYNRLCFLTATGLPFVRVQDNKREGALSPKVGINVLSQRFAKLVKKLELPPGRNFYALRHTFATVAGESRDQVAVDAVMGHVDGSMAGQYRERISDERLMDVVDAVHDWLFSTYIESEK